MRVIVVEGAQWTQPILEGLNIDIFPQRILAVVQASVSMGFKPNRLQMGQTESLTWISPLPHSPRSPVLPPQRESRQPQQLLMAPPLPGPVVPGDRRRRSRTPRARL